MDAPKICTAKPCILDALVIQLPSSSHSYTDANEVKERIESYFEDERGELIHKETKGLELKE